MKKMKCTNIVTVFCILLICLGPTLSTAEERMITFEMGESGHSISFPMTQKEILAAERTDKVIKEIIERKSNKPQIMWESYELAESGSTINFPMSEERKIEAKQKYEKLVDHHEKMSDLQKEMDARYETFEFGESGQTVKFLKIAP